jgi:hypothetical protein
LTDVQRLSYLSNPPVEAAVAAAGGNWWYPQCHDPGWGNISPAMQVVLDKLIDVLLPNLREQYNNVHQLFDNTLSFDVRKHECLFQAKGAVAYVKFAVEHALLMLASRPVRKVLGKWTLQVHSDVLYDLSDKLDGRTVFSLPIFTTPAFDQLKACVAQAQDREVAMLTHLPLDAETALGTSIRQSLQPLYHSMDQTLLVQRHSNDQARLAQQHSNVAFQNAMFQQMDTLAAQQLAIIPNAQPPLPTLPTQLQPPAQPNIALPALQSPLILDVELPDWDLDHDNCLTLLDYWNEYDKGYAPQGGRERPPFKVRERRHGTAWRLRKMRQWWGRRRCIYVAVLYFKSQGNSIAESINLANVIYMTGQLHGRRNQERSKKALNDYVDSQGLSTNDKDALLKEYEMEI